MSRFGRRRSFGLLMAGLAAAALAITGCSASKTSGSGNRADTVIFDIGSGRVEDPSLFNPFLPSSRNDQGSKGAMIEPLFLMDLENGKIMPWLATSMTSTASLDDWTMKLRPDVKWSDGVAFGADDVVFTMNMLITHPDLVGGSDLAQWVKKVTKVDDTTVHFTLKQANPRFQLDYFTSQISGVSSNYVVPKHIWQGQDPLTFKNYDSKKGWPVWTGPYKLASASSSDFVYTRDDDWWGAKADFMSLPKPKRLEWVAPGPESSRTQRMADHQLDSLMDVSPGSYEALKAKNSKIIAWETGKPYLWPDPCERNLELNNEVKPWNDPKMRWALNYAIDRNQIVATAYEGSSQPSDSIFPAYPALTKYVDQAKQAGLYDQYPLMTHDPDKAKQLIESAGWRKSGEYYSKDGKTLSLDIEEDEPTIETQRVAQVIVEELQAIGVDASTRNVAEGTWIDDYSLGNFEAQVTSSTCGSVVEPWKSLDTLSNKHLLPIGKRTDWGFNGVRYNSAEYSALVAQIGNLPLNDPQVGTKFLQAWKIFLRDLPVIPVTQARKIVPFDTTYWKGWPSADNPYIQPASWWQSTQLIIHHLTPAK
jgi:peptide/nickel transport system substrate-binding protein